MPEGDSVWRTARRLDQALSGRELTASDFRVPAFATVDLSGRRVDETVSRGKHLLTRIGDVTLHTHLKMEGRWQVYRPGERWRQPGHAARVVLHTREVHAVGFWLGITELVPRDAEGQVVGHLGPDLLGPDWDVTEAVRRLLAAPEREVFSALLDQRNLAGLGTEYTNELLFTAGLSPRRRVAEVPDLVTLVERGRRMLTVNRDRPVRTFTGDTRRGRTTWVFDRAGRTCRRCGTPLIHDELGEDPVRRRRAVWCPHCQT